MNIPDFKDDSGKWVKNLSSKKGPIQTISGQKWVAMRNRCKVGGSQQQKQSAYIGCYMSEEFKNFELFAQWHIKQIGYGIENYELDKDLLFQGNKEYASDKCVLVPRFVNLFTVSSTHIREGLPQGVSFHKKTGKYQARVSIDDKSTYLGVFVTEQEAFNAYVIAKEVEARRIYCLLLDNKIIIDLKVLDILKNWKFPEK